MALPLKVLDIPLQGGLSQKQDQYWLEPGSSLSMWDLVATKKGSKAKRRGMQVLTKAYEVCGNTPRAPSAGTIAKASRLFSRRRALSCIGSPNVAPLTVDYVFSYVDGGYGPAQWELRDLTPEAYLYPYEPISPPNPGANGAFIYGPGQNWNVQSIDTIIVNGVEFIAWTTPGGALFVMSRDAYMGVTLQPPYMIQSQQADNPRFVTNGATASYFGGVSSAPALFWSSTADRNIYANPIDATTGGLRLLRIRVNVTAGDAINELGAGLPCPYDVSSVTSDHSTYLLYARDNGGTRSVTLVKLDLSFAFTSSVAVSASDTQWTTDNGVSAANSAITACVVRADAANAEIAFSYAWKTTTTNRISAGLYNYVGLTQKRATINLFASPPISPISATADNAPFILTLERVTTGAGNSQFQTRWSPAQGVLAPASTQLPYIAAQKWSDNGAALVAAGGQSSTPGVTLWSRDVVLNGIAYCIGYVPSNTQGTFFLFADDQWKDTAADFTELTGKGLDRFPLRLVGTIAPRLSSALVPSVSAPLTPRTAARFYQNPYAGSSVYQCYVTTELASISALVGTRQQVDFASTQKDASAELGGNAILASGAPSGFDGSRCFELGFPYYPAIISVIVAGGAGSLSTGTYNYIAVYVWTDGAGQRHQSGRSAPVSVVAASTNTATVTIATLGFTNRSKSTTAAVGGSTGTPQDALMQMSIVGIKLYRTQVNGTFYTNVLANDAIIEVNDGTVLTVQVTDGASDASIAANPTLYGDGSDGTNPGNILDALCPPAFQHVVVHQMRVYGCNGTQVWPSKAFTTGEGSAFHEQMAFGVDDGPGNIVALASLDEKLVIFKRDRILYVTGFGPADNGQDNDYSFPQRIVSDTGCADWRSVCTTPQGVFFMSPMGRRLLTRDLQVVPVPTVEDIDVTQYPYCTSMVVHPRDGQIVSAHNVNETSSPRTGIFAVNDYVLGEWSLKNVGNVGAVSMVIADAVTAAGPPVTIQPTLHHACSDGRVFRESYTSNFDERLFGVQVYLSSEWTSPWIRADGLQGWSHWSEVRVAFIRKDDCALTITLSYQGYEGMIAPSDTFTFTAAQISAMAQSGDLCVVNVQPTQPRCAMIQIDIIDTPDGNPTTGAGVVLEGVRVQYGVEGPGYKPPITQQK